jgi:MYXO-CTERM domain-containing protein
VKIILGKIGFIAAALIFSSILMAPAAKADTITYTFTGDGIYAGTSFTYVTTSFLSFSTTELTPTTAGNLEIAGNVFGTVTGFEFISANAFEVFAGGASNETVDNGATYFINAATTGENVFAGTATLVITDTPSVTAPETSTLSMLVLGLAGLFGLAFFRRRKVQATTATA